MLRYNRTLLTSTIIFAWAVILYILTVVKAPGSANGPAEVTTHPQPAEQAISEVLVPFAHSRHTVECPEGHHPVLQEILPAACNVPDGHGLFVRVARYACVPNVGLR